MYKYDIQSNLFRSIFYLKVGTNIKMDTFLFIYNI